MNQLSNTTVQLQALLERAAGGDAADYRAIVEHALERLLALTRKLFRNYPRLRRWEQTDDIFQRLALRLHQSLSEVKPPNVRAFFGLASTQIRRILLDLSRHYFGKEGQGAKQLTDYPVSSRAIAKSTEPETLEAWSAFHEHIGGLSPDTREVFEMVWYSGLRHSEVADLLGVSLATVGRRWREARIALYERMTGVSPEA